jgi:hypothetical protein
MSLSVANIVLKIPIGHDILTMSCQLASPDLPVAACQGKGSTIIHNYCIEDKPFLSLP